MILKHAWVIVLPQTTNRRQPQRVQSTSNLNTLANNMKLAEFQSSQADEVVSLFESTFSDSEGAEEGKSIGQLVRQLIDTTAESDLFGFCAEEHGALLGGIFFSRFTLPVDRSAFLLSPVAVATQHQRKGIGQSLISYGLAQIMLDGVEFVVTYGDPAYYSKVGFEAISEAIISSPYTLTYPEGWQAQSLSSSPLSALPGKTQCVEAFRSQAYW